MKRKRERSYRVIPTGVKAVIADIYQANPNQPAKVIQYKLKQRLGARVPGLSCVQKELAKIRLKDKRIKKKTAAEPVTEGLDSPWSLGALVKYPISPEALPVILRVWQKCLAEQEEGFGLPFTIRDALWVERLSRLFDSPEDIWGFASWYSIRERSCELVNLASHTLDLDTQLLKLLGLLSEDASEINLKSWWTMTTKGGEKKGKKGRKKHQDTG